jgi:SAM-dependent methyltransferase
MGGKITKSMSDRTEHDYVLGTHDEEIARLGLQHGVWRPRVLDCWRNAGITIGSRVLDVGAGPGYATLDLGEIVGPTGQVVAIERSARFLQHAKEACRSRGLKNVQFRLMDLMRDSMRASGGEPDIALSLPKLLEQAGFRIRRMNAIVFAVTAGDCVWQWPSTFIESGLRRLRELERVDARWVDSVRREFLEAQADPATVMITPMILEIIAERGD